MAVKEGPAGHGYYGLQAASLAGVPKVVGHARLKLANLEACRIRVRIWGMDWSTKF